MRKLRGLQVGQSKAQGSNTLLVLIGAMQCPSQNKIHIKCIPKLLDIEVSHGALLPIVIMACGHMVQLHVGLARSHSHKSKGRACCWLSVACTPTLGSCGESAHPCCRHCVFIWRSTYNSKEQSEKQGRKADNSSSLAVHFRFGNLSDIVHWDDSAEALLVIYQHRSWTIKGIVLCLIFGLGIQHRFLQALIVSNLHLNLSSRGIWEILSASKKAKPYPCISTP